MVWIKRITLFLAVNFLVVLTVSFLLNCFHVGPYIRGAGLDLSSLIAFSLIWGMVGSIISLLLSKKIAIWMLQVQIVPPSAHDPTSQFLLKTVQTLAQKAHLSAIPEIGIFKSPQVNAFATGATKRHSLIALSTQLMKQLTEDQIEAVIAHEMSHISNGDMVTMTLLQGIINAFVLFLSRILAFAASGFHRDRRHHSSLLSYYFFTFLFEFFFMLLGSLVVAFFSRMREFRADRGGARLTTPLKMIAALEGLKASYQKTAPYPKAVQCLMMQPGPGFSLLKLFASHPSLEERINALRQ